jgi:hypothetical protein
MVVEKKAARFRPAAGITPPCGRHHSLAIAGGKFHAAGFKSYSRQAANANQ